MTKRAFDLAVSSLALLAVAPLLLVLAILVKLSSPGPVLFRQERVGRNFRRFRINKFRTMVVDAPHRGGQITVGEDPRVTRVGRFLRKTKLDELPQLFNVLLGEMSFVGPRPEVPKYVEMFRSDYEEVLRVRPGITDLASLKYRDESTLLGQAPDPEQMYVGQVLPDKIALAKEYIRQASLRYDLWIIFRTVAVVGRG